MLSHSLVVEFPELAKVIHDLKMTNQHFAHLLERYDTIDMQIVRDEERIESHSDNMMHELKQQRLKLKDELYKMATAA
jgi:uncharacterized protein YdcH (DUF465 family)